MPNEVTPPTERKVYELPRGADGLFDQPDWEKMSEGERADFARDMQKRRMGAAHDADFADAVTGIPNTNDPTSEYICNGCNRANGTKCVRVRVKQLNLESGSCDKWEIKCVGDPEHDNQALTPEEAGYAIRAVKGGQWSCNNCPLKEQSGFVDQLNRIFWCRQWAFTVRAIDCCGKNAASRLKLDKDGMPVGGLDDSDTASPGVEERERSVRLKRSAQSRTIRKVIPLKVADVEGNPNRSRFIAATNQLARDGHVLEPSGMEIDNFLRCGTILFDHDPKIPIGAPVATALNSDGDLEIEIEWAPSGISGDADKIRGLVKAGVLRSGSVGFDVLDGEPLDPKKPRGGLHITKSELLEFSVVSVPADTGAVVTQRSAEDWKCGVSRDLPIEDSDEWDGAAAESSIFEWAGGDDFDPSKARKGFLAYNAAKPKERGSYKLPIAHITGGRLKVPKGAIRAAAPRLPQADIPDTVKESAREVLDHYEEKAGMSEKDNSGTDRAVVVKHRRALERAPKLPMFKRGLYDVAALASILGQVGYATDCAEWEAEIEEDDSKVPGMLGEALKQLGEALIAMTAEEVGELLAMHDKDAEDSEQGDVSERAFVLAGKTPRLRAWRRAVVMARAGKAISATNAERLEQAQGHQERAIKHHSALGEHHAAVTGHLDELGAAHKRSVKAHGDLGEALEAVTNEPAKATEHVARALKLHGAIEGHHEDVAEAYEGAVDRHQDAGDAYSSLGRSIRAAQRSVRAVVEGSTPSDDDSDSKEVQTAAGTEESDGSASGRSHRQRQKDIQELAAIGRSYN